uniref:Uncharacterized protein n=1 Tax=Anguilla anguilla TaxID=7936 RepID=A0A0E9PEE8_ANGAN
MSRPPVPTKSHERVILMVSGVLASTVRSITSPHG